MTHASDAPGSFFGELVKISRDLGNQSHLEHALHLFSWRHRRSSPSTLPCSPKVHDVDSLLQGTGYCKPVFGGAKVRCSFFWYLLNPSSSFQHSWWFSTVYLQCENCWDVGVQPCASSQPRRHSTDGWTRLACDSLCKEYSLVRCTSSLVRASEFKPHPGICFGLHRQRRHPGCTFPTNLKHRYSPTHSVLHPLAEGLLRGDPLAGAAAFDACLKDGEQASLTVGQGTSDLWSWGFGCPGTSFGSWENPTARRRRPLVEVLNGLEKRDCHFSVGKASSASRQIPIGLSGCFRFRREASRSQCRGG